MTDTKDVAYVRERLCTVSDVLNEIFVKTKEMSEENTKLKKELKEICEKYLDIKTTVSAYEDACKDLHAYIEKLKELLRECREHLITYKRDDLDKGYVVYDGLYLIDKINQVLGEE